jgi:hypothetical protein
MLAIWYCWLSWVYWSCKPWQEFCVLVVVIDPVGLAIEDEADVLGSPRELHADSNRTEMAKAIIRYFFMVFFSFLLVLLSFVSDTIHAFSIFLSTAPAGTIGFQAVGFAAGPGGGLLVGSLNEAEHLPMALIKPLLQVLDAILFQCLYIGLVYALDRTCGQPFDQVADVYIKWHGISTCVSAIKIIQGEHCTSMFSMR